MSTAKDFPNDRQRAGETVFSATIKAQRALQIAIDYGRLSGAQMSAKYETDPMEGYKYVENECVNALRIITRDIKQLREAAAQPCAKHSIFFDNCTNCHEANQAQQTVQPTRPLIRDAAEKAAELILSTYNVTRKGTQASDGKPVHIDPSGLVELIRDGITPILAKAL